MTAFHIVPLLKHVWDCQIKAHHSLKSHSTSCSWYKQTSCSIGITAQMSKMIVFILHKWKHYFWLQGNELSKWLLECIALNVIKCLAPLSFSKRRRLAVKQTVFETHYTAEATAQLLLYCLGEYTTQWTTWT